jgi:hypothetical protein
MECQAFFNDKLVNPICINPFPADVANKRHLGSPPNPILWLDWESGKTEVIDLSDW